MDMINIGRTSLNVEAAAKLDRMTFKKAFEKELPDWETVYKRIQKMAAKSNDNK